MKNDLLFLVAIPILLIAMPSNAFALLNQTNVNETNNLLKQILDQQKLQIQLQQSNANVTATKLARIMAQLHQLQQPANTNITNPVIGCGIGTDNSLCNLPVPPPPSPPLSPPPFLAWLPPDLGIGAVTDCIYTVYGVFCPTN